jgi:acyl-coenzyme A synthetase/AMP-(fatty) acid ligase
MAGGYILPPAVWSRGGTVVFDQRPACVEHLFDHPITFCFLSPSGAEAVTRAPLRSAPSTRPLIVVGGGPFSLAAATELIGRTGAALRLVYGSTELVGCRTTALVSDFRSREDLDTYSVCPGRRVEIVDEQGNECPPGQEGLVRVPLEVADATGYLDDPDATARHFRDGCFYPGDIGVRLTDGRIRIIGRPGDVLIAKGGKHALAPLEGLAKAFVGGNEVCLYSRLDATGADQLVVVIETDGSVTPQQLQTLGRWLAETLQFRNIHMTGVGRFPRTGGGMQKIDRQALRRMVVEPTASESATG